MQVGSSTRARDVRRSGRIPEGKDSCSRALVKEVECLRQMGEGMKEFAAGLRFEDKGADTGSSVTTTGVNQDREEQDREEAAGNIRTE